MTRRATTERWAVIALILVAWALRWVALLDVPPGWRDDDLIELYTFSQRIVDEGPVLYFPGASGHEPLYHALRAPVLALAGINQASARWVSASAGTLATLLTWAVGRRLLGRRVGLLAGALVAVSFWGLMYSRVAIRHIGALPWMLTAIYWASRQARDARTSPAAVAGVAVGIAGALLTYYAGRLLPALLLAVLPLVAPLRRRWRGYLLGIALGLLAATPMFWAASQLPGADARVGELAVPLRALRSGDIRPLVQTTWTTLGMAHARGDPEWLYNVSERPVFGQLGALAFYTSLAGLLIRWRRPSVRVLLLWLAVGIAPAFISLPPSSYGHTILALPAVYLILATGVDEAWTRLERQMTHADPLPAPSPALRGARARTLALLAARTALPIAVLAIVASRDLDGYFRQWPAHSMVRFLYRADYRALAAFLDARPSLAGCTVGSMLFGPWDKVALQTDLAREDAGLRWANPERAIVFIGGEATQIFLQDEGTRQPALQDLLAISPQIEAPRGMQGYAVAPVLTPDQAAKTDAGGMSLAEQPFAGALALEAVAIEPPTGNDEPVWVITWWRVVGPLPLPAEELVPNPPPPGVYNGPRLKVFAHLYVAGEQAAAGGEPVASDDGLWVDPYTLQPGDLVVQWHRFGPTRASDTGYRLVLGLYDPLSGARWLTAAGNDSVAVDLSP